MKSILRLTLIFLIVLALVGITSLYYIFDSRPLSREQGTVDFTVQDGATLSAIADLLHENSVIRSPTSFKMAARLLRKTRAIYPGVYTLSTRSTNTEAIEALAHARAVEITVTIPEGLRSDEIISLLSSKLGLDSLKMDSLLTDPVLLQIAGSGFQHLEGTLYPETYRFLENSDELMVMQKLVTHFRAIIKPALLAKAQTFGFDLHQLITFASLVEKETGRADERTLVSSVYHNRLKQNMLLGCDPTLIYMLVRRGEWHGNIRRKHFAIKDPYNSYLYRALPPGPIANPGLASILASLEPEDTQSLYFLGKNDGSGYHDFSKTLREHTNKVNRYQRRRRTQ